MALYGAKLPPRPSENQFGSDADGVVGGEGAKKKKSTRKSRSASASAIVAAAVGDLPQEKKKTKPKRKAESFGGAVATGGDGTGSMGGGGSDGAVKAVKLKPAKAACRLFGKFVVVPFEFGDASPVDWLGQIVAEKAGRKKGEVYFQALFEEDGQKVWYEEKEVGKLPFCSNGFFSICFV